MAAVALGASAGYSLEKVWEYTNIGDITPADCRQGLGMNGKFYINNKATSTITIYDQTGPIGTLPGSPNCTIGRDEAGNIVMSNTAFPGNWGIGSTFTVMNPATGATKVYTIPEECGDLGRCDVLGIAKGDLMTDGILYLATNTSGSTIVKVVIEDGEVNTDDSYAPDCSGVSQATTNPIYAYTDLDGNDALLYNNRTANPIKLLPDGDGYAGTAIVLPNRGTTMGLQPFVWKGHEFFLYNYKLASYVDYLDGVAVAMNHDAEPRAYVPATVTVAGNGNQINWLWAEPGENEVTIYQYYPGTGGHLTVYRMVETPDYYVGCNLLGNWNYGDYMMELDEESGLYTLAVDSVQIQGGTMIEYKVTTGIDWWPTDYNAEYYIGETGLYNLVFTFNLEGYIVGIQVTKLEEPVPDMVYTVAGPEHVFGTDWDPTDTNNDMVLDPETNLYTWTKQNVELNDFFGFKVVGNHAWESYEWPIGYENNYNVYLTEGPGIYDIVITFNPDADPEPALTCTLTKKVTRGDATGEGEVNMDDLAVLINYLLDNSNPINFGNAAICDALDSNEDNMDDLSALINYLLTNTWPN